MIASLAEPAMIMIVFHAGAGSRARRKLSTMAGYMVSVRGRPARGRSGLRCSR